MDESALPGGVVPGRSRLSAARRAAREERLRDELEALNEIARIATLDLELRPTLQRITDALMHHFDWPFVACISVDAARGTFVCEALSTRLPTEVRVGYGRALGSGVVGEVAATGRPILLDDVAGADNYVETSPGARSELCVPVWHGGRIVALLNLESDRPAAFRGQLRLLQTVAEQVSGAIASVFLHREVKRQAHLLERVSEVSRVALEAGDLDALLERIVRYVDEQFALARVAIIWIDVARQEFVLAAHAGRIAFDVAPGSRWPLTAGIVGRAVRTGQPQLALDVRADPDYVKIHDTVVSELAVPIRFRDQTLGAFDLESTTPEAFSAEDVVVFRTFADQLAGAMHLAAINRQLAEANERLREANEALQRLSRVDGLTGVPNRRRFDEALDIEWRRLSRTGVPLALLLIDIDCFKPYNDTYGHQQGDDCLRRVAEVLQESLQRAGDLLARYGGEEFAAVLPATDAAGALAYAEALRAAVEALALPHRRSTVTPVVTVSLGVATARPGEATSPAKLLARADRALYAAKRAGRNRVEAG